MKEKKITKENIHQFVIKFYTNILEDDIVSPEFKRILGDDITNSKWQDHIELLSDFWATMVLSENSYIGSPFPVHTTMQNLSRETFYQWLNILDYTLDEIYEKECQANFKNVGSIMAKNFMMKLGL